MPNPDRANSRPNGGHALERPTSAPPLYAQDGQGYNALVHAHYFVGSNDWLVTEYEPETGIAFGWACLGGDRQNAELGYVDLAELESIAIPLRIHDVASGRVLESKLPQRVELEKDWPVLGTTLTQAIAELDRRQGRG